MPWVENGPLSAHDRQMERRTSPCVRQSLEDSKADIAAGRFDDLDAYSQLVRARIRQRKEERDQEAAG
jgi:hypothetical protein